MKNKKLEPNMILDEFMDYYQSYSWRDEIGGDHSTAQRYMRQDLKRLVEARMGERISRETLPSFGKKATKSTIFGKIN